MNSNQDKIIIPIIVILSILIPVVVAMLMYLPESITRPGINVTSLPFFHAFLNGSTAFFLSLGYYFIRRKKITYHKYCMLVSFGLSSVFLVSYIIYHFASGHTPFGGEGLVRPLYFFILITHIAFATIIIPLALLSIYRGISNDIARHRKIAKWTFPIWLYVAITGVLVYLFMIPYYYT